MDYMPQITPEMKSRYVTRRKEDLEKVEAALTANDFETLKKIAHQIKGNAATFNFSDLEATAIEIEKAALDENRTASETAVAAFRTWLASQTTT